MLQPLNGIRGFLLRGLHLAGLAMAIGITICGTRLITDGLVRKNLKLILWFLKTSGIARELRQLIRRPTDSDLQQCLLDFSNPEHTLILLFATFSAATLSPLVAITILQFKHTNTLMAQDPLHLCHESGPSI
jgi:hypothetical protein